MNKVEKKIGIKSLYFGNIKICGEYVQVEEQIL